MVGFHLRDLPIFNDGPNVLARTADQEWQVVSLLDFHDRCPGFILEEGKTPDLVWISEIDQVVGNLVAIFEAWFSCADIHSAVYEA